MKPYLTIIFDRSAFHGERFNQFVQSPLKSLTKNGKVIVHHSAVFLEETISMYEKPKNREQLRSQITYIIEICNGRWIRQSEQIWHREFIRTQHRNRIFEKEWRRRATERKFLEGALGNQEWSELLAAIPLKDFERQKQYRQRMLQVEMRQVIADAKRDNRSLKNQDPPRPSTFIKTEIDSWGEELIRTFIHCRDRQYAVQVWKEHKSDYPFFTSFAEGLLYADWHAMVEHSKRIDQNSQVDVQLLCNLHCADAVVSYDNRFQRDLFEILWKPIGKRMFTPDEFIDYLNSLK